MNESEVVNKVISEFPGARVVTQINPLPEIENTPLAAARGKIRKRITDHEECALDYAHSPVAFHGPSDCAFTVIGEAPGKEEEQLGRPFVGKSGKLLRAMIQQYANVDPDEVFWMNTLTCHPKREGTTRAPTTAEMMAGRGLMMDTLSLSRSRNVLLVGATALSAFRYDLKLSALHGSAFIWKSRYLVMPVFHPALILRKQEMKKDLADDLEKWADVLKGNWHRYMGRSCVKCSENVYELDPDGVGYCRKHWERYGMKAYRKAVDKWRLPGGMQTTVWDYADPMRVNKGAGDYV